VTAKSRVLCIKTKDELIIQVGSHELLVMMLFPREACVINHSFVWWFFFHSPS
jgi:hypothetical protein